MPRLAASAALRLQQLHPEPDRPIDLSAWRRRSPSAFSYVAGPCDDSTPSRARPLICRWWSAGTVAPPTGGHHSNRRPSNSGRAIDGSNHHSRGRWLISSSSTPLWNRTRRQPRQSTRTDAGEAEVARSREVRGPGDPRDAHRHPRFPHRRDQCDDVRLHLHGQPDRQGQEFMARLPDTLRP